MVGICQKSHTSKNCQSFSFAAHTNILRVRRYGKAIRYLLVVSFAYKEALLLYIYVAEWVDVLLFKRPLAKAPVAGRFTERKHIGRLIRYLAAEAAVW